jgi:predicted DNA-binding transcriptional regulator YafY
VLALLEILQSGGTRTVTELAARLEVDERTVRRYVGHLIDLDVPVESVRGRHGGYRLSPGYKMPPLMLTEQEALAVLLGLLAGRRAGSPHAATSAAGSVPAGTVPAGTVPAGTGAAGTAAAKLRRVLPRPLQSRLDALLATTEFTPTTSTAERARAAMPETRVLLTLAEAARDRHPVTIGYRDRHGNRSDRTLRPYGLVAHSGRWYVAGGDSASAEVRTFRLDRIAELRVLPETFTPPEGFDPAAHVLTGLAQAPYTHEVSLRVHGTAARIRSGFPEGLALISELPASGLPASGLPASGPPASGLPPQPDGEAWFGVSLRAERLDWLPAVLAGLGCPFVIERPAALRGLVRDLARRLEGYAAADPGE